MGEGLVEEKRNDARRIKSLLEANTRMLEEKRELQKKVTEADVEVQALVKELGHMKAVIESDPDLLRAYNDPDMVKLDEWFRETFSSPKDILVMENDGLATAVIRAWNQARDKWHLSSERARKAEEDIDAVIAGRNLLADDVVMEKQLHNHTRNTLATVLDGFTAFRESVASGRIKSKKMEKMEKGS